MKLNLETKTREQELVKAYLEYNASDTLADKINNGTPFEKDGKTLVNRKTLDGFMKYATEEARKLASKGANSACVEDNVVYGWTIHYFEEDGIECTLYNPDGTEYKPEPKTKTVTVKKAEVKPARQEHTLFDLLEGKEEQSEEEKKCVTPTGVKEQSFSEQDVKTVEAKPQRQISPLWLKYMEIQSKYPDCILLYRLGDFYEVFGDYAVTLCDELGLTLTSRDFGFEGRVPMIGFPYHAADNYLKKLLQKHKVAITETLEDIKLLPEEEKAVEEPEEDFDMSAFDPDALAVLSDIFGDILTLR